MSMFPTTPLRFPNPHPRLALTFVHEGGETAITLRKRRLRFRFKANPPQPFVMVSFVHEGSHAESAGVRVGMELVAINGESTEGVGAKELLTKLQALTAKLEEQWCGRLRRDVLSTPSSCMRAVSGRREQTISHQTADP